MASVVDRSLCLLSLLLVTGITDEDVPWYQAVSTFHFPRFFANEFGDTTSSILPTLANSTAQYVMVDFYAPWCPHCQHFAPEFERLALSILRQPAEPRILAATVDCVRYASTCSEWGVDSFPTLLWGRRIDWLDKAVQRLQPIEPNSATAEGVADWINVHVPIHLDPASISRQEVVQLFHWQATNSSAGDALQPHMLTVDAWDIQLSTALLIHETLARHAFSVHGTSQDAGHIAMEGPIRALLDLLNLLSQRFPEQHIAGDEATGDAPMASTPCRDSLRRLSEQLSSNWTKLGQHMELLQGGEMFMIDPTELESRWRLCGTEWGEYSGRSWRSCRGTWPGKRGFTCGLWSLFHTVVARGDDTTALHDTNTIRAVIEHLFDCRECREHFLQLPWNESDSLTRRSAQLWWWNAHNLVNQRVQQLEQQFQDGDPGFPKVQWPPAAQCTACRASKDSSFLTRSRGDALLHRRAQDAPVPTWRLDEVVGFLDRFYGGRT